MANVLAHAISVRSTLVITGAPGEAQAVDMPIDHAPPFAASSSYGDPVAELQRILPPRDPLVHRPSGPNFGAKGSALLRVRLIARLQAV
jgi:hypothetical protein